VPARARVGTCGWDKDPWVGYFYPPRFPRADRLRFLAARMTTVEINSTFHGFQRSASFAQWRKLVPADFVFSVKASRVVTHELRLVQAERGIAEFLASGVLLLGEKLGPILWQLPPDLGFQRDVTMRFLSALPHTVDDARRLIAHLRVPIDHDLSALPDRPLRHCIEVRNASFAHPEFAGLLGEHRIAAAVTNTPGWPSIDPLTSDFVYMRLHGDVQRWPNGYDEDTFDVWTRRIKAWRDGTTAENDEAGEASDGREVFVYFDTPDHGGFRSPFDAVKLQGMVGDARPGPDPTFQATLWG
jgi:uncharacterized protein YecE (DUF72 family)